jgi:hypothetical protein
MPAWPWEAKTVIANRRAAWTVCVHRSLAEGHEARRIDAFLNINVL